MAGSSENRIENSKKRLVLTMLLFLLGLFVLGSGDALAQKKKQLDEMSLERWAKLREVQRHQIQIAEKYYREKNWKVAAAEYDKYLSLYENSDAASYALLRWSICQVNLRKQNTAIHDGFRSVIDYWPDSDDAVAAGYYIGKTYKDIGQNSKAKPALKDVTEKHAKHIAGVYAMVALAEIAETENDDELKVDIWRKLTFEAIRTKQTLNHCNSAAIKFAKHQFYEGDFDEAVEAVKISSKKNEIEDQVVQRGKDALRRLVDNSETQSKAKNLASKLVSYLQDQQPDDATTEAGKTRAKHLMFLVADVHRAAKDDAQVAKTFSTIEKRFGADDEFLAKVALWHRSKEQYEKARAEYRKFKNKANGLSNIASTFRQEKNLSLAVSTYEQLTNVDSDNAIKWKAEKATTYREFHKWDEAIAVYQELLKQDVSASERWLWEIATCYNYAGKWKEAIGFYRQTDRFPQNYQEMARCHRRLKQHGEAIALYNQIVGGSKPHAPWALLQIGYTQEEAKSKDKAITAFKKVCKLFPKDRHASIAHAHLQNKYKLSVTLGGAKDE